jgi:hypothetical protein
VRVIVQTGLGSPGEAVIDQLKADFVSRQKILGIPLLHISSGSARGVIAIGEKATGVLAVGRLAMGLVSVGAVSIGMISVGAISVGFAAAAGAVAIGFGRSAGAIAAGARASGAVALGPKTEGGLTIRLPSLKGDSEDEDEL